MQMFGLVISDTVGKLCRNEIHYNAPENKTVADIQHQQRGLDNY